MKIGIIDADLIDGGTKHPNLALMKISGYYKSKGDNIYLIENYDDIDDSFDKLFLSKVFTFTNIPKDVLKINNLVYGGTGFSEMNIKVNDLDFEIEHHKPDYNLYDSYVEKRLLNGDRESRWKDYKEFSIGFITRGCFRHCEFCVNRDKNTVYKHADIDEFIDYSRKRIYLWDDNFLGYRNWEEELELLIATNKYFQFRQGLDIRLIDDKKAKKLSECKYFGDYIFAFDHIEDSKLIDEKLTIWRNHCKKGTKLYLFCAYYSIDANDIANIFKRIKILIKHNCIPYIMRYEKYKESNLKDLYTSIARWCNQPNIFKKMSFREFCTRELELKKDKNKPPKSYVVMKEFEEKYPKIANKYFDLKYGVYK